MLTKNVNGTRVELTDDEETAKRAEWAAAEAAVAAEVVLHPVDIKIRNDKAYAAMVEELASANGVTVAAQTTRLKAKYDSL